MGIIDSALSRVIPSLPTLDLTSFAVTGNRLAWEHDAINFDLGSYPGPGWESDEPYTPTAEEAAEALGYTLGMAGEAARYPREVTHDLNAHRAFNRGYNRGAADLEAANWADHGAYLDERQARNEALEAMFGHLLDDIPQCELVRGGSACGHAAE